MYTVKVKLQSVGQVRDLMEIAKGYFYPLSLISRQLWMEIHDQWTREARITGILLPSISFKGKSKTLTVTCKYSVTVILTTDFTVTLRWRRALENKTIMLAEFMKVAQSLHYSDGKTAYSLEAETMMKGGYRIC